MAGNVVRVRLEADASKWDQGFDKAQAKAVGFGSAVGVMVGTLAANLGTKALTAVTDFVGQSADAFSNLEQAVGGTEAVFGDASAIEDFAKRSAKEMGLSEAAFRVATTGIGGQLKRMTGDVDLAAEQSIILTQTAADLAATYGGTTAEAVQALGAAFRGEADPAERFNLDLKVGRVNAKALEMGLADTTGAIDDTAKAQALLALITEQSADAQGQFARETDTAAGRTQILTAEIENQQAALGENAAEWRLFWLQQKSNVAEGGSVVLNWFSAFSDDITAAERDMRDFEIRTGTTADTAKAAVTIWKEYGTSMFDLIDVMNLNTIELQKLKDADEAYLLSLGFTEEGIVKLDAAITEQIEKTNAQAQATQSAGDIIAQNLVPAEEELEEAVDDANVEIQTQNELLSDTLDRVNNLISPVFGYITAQEDLAAAQEAYNKAVEEFGENSPEAIQAAEDIANANMGIQEAVVAIGEEGVPAAMEALATMGVPQAVIDRFASDRKKIEEIFRNMVLRIGVTAPSLFPTRPAGGGVGWQSDSNAYYAKGGVATGATAGIFGEAGREAVIPLENQTGIDFMAAALKKAGVGGGGPGIYLTVNALDPQSAARAVVEALQSWQRSNGAIPVQVRG